MKHSLLSENEQLSTHLHGEDMKVEEIKDTQCLQMQSLTEFMQALGYYLQDDFFTNAEYFYSHLQSNKGHNTISVRTAINLHNGNLMDNHGKRFREPFIFDEYRMTRAQASKIVRICKLQYSKKSNRFIVQSHKVQFVKDSYYDIFMGGE